MVIAHHLILTGYGHWLPNDPRGSYSRETFQPELRELADTHFGRRTEQPTRQELRAFYREASARLAHRIVWFEDKHRTTLMRSFGEVIRTQGLTCYACAVLNSHAHLILRRHRIRGEQMFSMLNEAGRDAIHAAGLAPPTHPVFSAGECVLYKADPEAVRNCIRYIDAHYRKHRLTPIPCEFVVPYDNWPYHRSLRPPEER